MGFWTDKRVVVTGGGGFLGQHVVDALAVRGCRAFVARKREYDLVTLEGVRNLIRDARPEMILHLAAVVGGIGANRAHPGAFFYDNLMMGVQLIEEARKQGVGKVVALGTVCSYPKIAPMPLREESLWDGYPEETNAPYGLAKKMLLVQSQAYRQEYGFNSIFLLPVNLYGPRDNFDLQTSHVIPALIRKMCDAADRGDSEVVGWGDGSPTREFLHVEDGAEGILLAAEHYDDSQPVNLGSGEEISIKDLAAKVAEACGFRGKVVWDASQPNGQPRRKLDTQRAERLFGFKAKKSFAEGLKQTVEWYRATRSGNSGSQMSPG